MRSIRINLFTRWQYVTALPRPLRVADCSLRVLCSAPRLTSVIFVNENENENDCLLVHEN